jgi:Bor protein
MAGFSRIIARVCGVLFLVAATGCYQMTIKNGGAAEPPVERRQNLFALGFYGDPNVDVKKECPHGVANVASRFSAEDVLLTMASVGIYSPRTLTIECAREARG